MTKADIINEVAIATGMPKKEVGTVVEAFMEEVKKCLIEKKDNVYLRGFGSFNIKHRAAKTARNISKNTRKRRATRWLLTSVKKDYVRTDIRASKLAV